MLRGRGNFECWKRPLCICEKDLFVSVGAVKIRNGLLFNNLSGLAGIG